MHILFSSVLPSVSESKGATEINWKYSEQSLDRHFIYEELTNSAYHPMVLQVKGNPSY